MSILKISRMGHPILARRADPVASLLAGPDKPMLERLVTDMFETLADIGGVGLAAPQIHVSQRVIVFYVPPDRADDDGRSVPRTALLDPEFEPVNRDMVAGWEGCLSIPGLRGRVSRFRQIRFSGITLRGERVEAVASGFHARVLQHEIDHLDGILYPQRMDDLSLLMFEEEWRRFAAAGQSPASPAASTPLPPEQPESAS